MTGPYLERALVDGGVAVLAGLLLKAVTTPPPWGFWAVVLIVFTSRLRSRET